MSDSIQIKLKHIAITAEELLAGLRGRQGGIAVTGDLAEVANSLPSPAHHGMQQEINELRRHLGKVMSERDALQARIDAGVVVYGNTIAGDCWRTYKLSSCPHYTAFLIDRRAGGREQ